MLATGKGKAAATGPSSAVTYVAGTSRNNNTSSTSAVGDCPSGVQTGDLLVAYIAETGTFLKNVPSGWTYSPLTSVTQGARPWTAYKYASSSEPSTYTFEMNVATVTTVVIVAYRGGVVDTFGTGSSGVDTVNAAGVSAIASGGILLAAYTSQTGQGKTFSTPTGMSPVISNNSNSAMVAVFSQVISASGATGTRSSTATGASSSYGGCFYIRPGTTVGQQLFENFATMYWTVPKDVTSISMVAVGSGGGGGGTDFTSSRAGGGGGALSYSNAVSATPGEVLTVVVGVYGFAGANGADGTAGGDASVSRGGTTLLLAKGGSGGGINDGYGGAASSGVGSVKYSGGDSYGSTDIGNGGGGAAGYAGNGGGGGIQGSGSKAGTGGGGGGGGYGDASSRGGGGGGGVGIFGEGSNGTAGTNSTGGGGGGGSGGSAGGGATTDAGRAGGAYGGGGGSANDDGAAGANGAGGAVRIIWGSGRSFPSTNTSNQ